MAVSLLSAADAALVLAPFLPPSRSLVVQWGVAHRLAASFEQQQQQQTLQCHEWPYQLLVLLTLPLCRFLPSLPSPFLLLMQWGVAYRLAGNPEQQQQTLQYLEWREKQYDKRVHVDIHDSAGTAVVRGALVYLATDGPQNVNWLGPAPLQDIARQVGPF
jgi:hypothetical protein